ncbi:MAG: hypothetical protein AAB600_01935 [Patescibacteria group bacterium]
MNNKMILAALGLDLKRVALGLQRGSFKMANRFMQEAMARKKEIATSDIDQYLIKLLDKMEQSFKTFDSSKKAEDALMYSTLFQNASLKK